MERYFGQSPELKTLDDQDVTTRGYVSGGTFSAVDKNKPKESFEHLALGTYELRQDPLKKLPRAFYRDEQLVKDYVNSCEHVVDVILDGLSSILNLTGPAHLKHHHRHDQPSDTILAPLSYPERLTHQKHPDLGSLTVLFSDEWGLQAVTPASGQWEWVEPRARDAVINVGDMLRFLADKRLYSCVHSVVREGRAARHPQRYSIAYLLRAGDDATFDDVDGHPTTARDLVRAKYQAYEAPHAEQAKSAVLTGGMEDVLGVEA